ncbi:MAG: LCP family protein, partial [Oscillospiraceae bacterium]|nr:LCP family protein [Oscillospiraceae bacterium]
MNQYKIHPLPDGKKNKKPTKKPNKKKNSKKTGKNRGGKVLTAGRIVLLTFLSLLLVLFLSANIFLYVYKPPINLDEDLYEDLEDEFLLFVPDDGEGEGEVNPSADLSRKSDCYTFLILGVDRGSTLTDTMMIAIFDIKENTISILNIPRDTYVSTKNYSGLINGVYGRGRTNAAKTGSVGDEIAKEGIKYLNAMLKYTFGIPIDKYVLINLDGFKFLVDKIGGVEFEVPFRMKYTDPDQNLYIDLQPGLQTLYGKEAEQLIRFRHGDDGYGGYGRTI